MDFLYNRFYGVHLAASVCVYGFSREGQVCWRHEPDLPREGKKARILLLGEAFATLRHETAEQQDESVVHAVCTQNKLCFLAKRIANAAPAQDAPPAQDAAHAQDAPPAQDAAPAQDAPPAQDAAHAQDAAPAQDAAFVLVGPLWIFPQAVPDFSAQSVGFGAAQIRLLPRTQLRYFAQTVFFCANLPTVAFLAFPQQVQSAEKSRISPALEVVEADVMEQNHIRECTILKLIAGGCVQALQAYIDSSVLRENLPSHMHDYGLRTNKNLSLTQNSLASRAAIRGGLPALYARGLCAHYLDLIERCETKEQLRAHSIDNISLRYCEKVQSFLAEAYSPLVNRALYYLRLNLSSAPSLAQTANCVHVSQAHLSRCIKKETGKSFTQISANLRIEETKHYLENTALPIIEIVSLCGYQSATNLCRAFKQNTGKTPLQWREERNVDITA